MLRLKKIACLTGMAVLAFFAVAKSAMAAEAQSQVLHLDQGFLGHPVKLDILGGKAYLKWQAGDLLRPADINVSVSTSSEINIIWSTSYALGSRGVELGVKQDFGGVSATDTWHEAALEIKAPFGDWKRPLAVPKNGYLTAQVGPEIQAHVQIVPRGMRSGTATWYRHKRCLCAASPDFPAGTKLLVRNVAEPNKSVVVKVNDYGPDRRLFPKRVIDLDSVAFKKLAPLSVGMLEVTVEPAEAVALAKALKK